MSRFLICFSGFKERSDPGPAMMAFHGGGWVIGNPSKKTKQNINLFMRTVLNFVLKFQKHLFDADV